MDLLSVLTHVISKMAHESFSDHREDEELDERQCVPTIQETLMRHVWFLLKLEMQ